MSKLTPVFDPPRLAVFCGSRPGNRPLYREAATAMGRCLVRHGLGLVYGGGSVGLMGAVADAVLDAGGEVFGVIPDFMSRPEVAHQGLTELHVVETMHARKQMMAELSAGFIAMPGGLGTLEELFEVASWSQLGIQNKPIGLLNVAGYWAALLASLDAAVEEGFVNPVHRQLLMTSEEPEELLEQLASWIRERGSAATVSDIDLRST